MPVTKKLKCCKNAEKLRENLQSKEFKYMIKVLFVCHGSILKNPRKAHKINDFMEGKGTYYTTTTPFLKES